MSDTMSDKDQWLGWKVGLNPGAAREKVRVARALGELPRIAVALGRGELSYARPAARRVPPRRNKAPAERACR